MLRSSIMLVLIGALAVAGTSLADQPEESTDVERRVRQALKTYVEAFNRQDAAALAEHWSEQGEYSSPDGEKFTGRKAIEVAFTKLFEENKGLRLEVDQPTVKVAEPDLAIEEGVAVVSRQGEPPQLTRYKATHVKESGTWKLKSIEEVDVLVAPSHYEQLKALDWMVGEWVDRDDQSSLRTVCQWTKNRNFLTRSFQASIGGQIELEGTQVIGWDPLRQTIRSWVFDSDGGFSVGLWTGQDDRWTVKQLQVLPDGRQASATNVIRRVDDDTFTWQSIGREVDGEMLPNVEEVTIVRVQPE